MPTTFRLAESSSLFSQINSGNEIVDNSQMPCIQGNSEETMVSVVEIRESNTSPMMLVQNISYTDSMPHDQNDDLSSIKLKPKIGEIVSTISILECVDSFEPEFVETVNIVDASSDTDTCPSPAPLSSGTYGEMLIKTSFHNSFDELEEELEKELEALDCFHHNTDDDLNVFTEQCSQKNDYLVVERQRITFDGKHNKLNKDDDIWNENEKLKKNPRQIRRIIPTLREILNNEERDSFYSSDKENNDEPLTFSDDEDIPRFSIEMAPGDSDSDTVCERSEKLYLFKL